MKTSSRHTGNFVYENKTVLQNYSCYPFGMEQNGFNYTSTSTLKNSYLCNGKELQDDFGLEWYDYGARFYDTVLGRFTGIDPIADTFAIVTPYNYTENSPVANLDLRGLQVVLFQGVMATFDKKRGYLNIASANITSASSKNGFNYVGRKLEVTTQEE